MARRSAVFAFCSRQILSFHLTWLHSSAARHLIGPVTRPCRCPSHIPHPRTWRWRWWRTSKHWSTFTPIITLIASVSFFTRTLCWLALSRFFLGPVSHVTQRHFLSLGGCPPHGFPFDLDTPPDPRSLPHPPFRIVPSIYSSDTPLFNASN